MAGDASMVAMTGGEPAVIAITRLDLTDFRSYREARFDLGTGPVVLTGPNGAGKTNVLEAVSFLAPGRGLRRARLGEVDHQPGLLGDGDLNPPRAGGYPWAVAARLSVAGVEVRIGTGRDGQAVGDRRLVRIDGQATKGQAALAQYLNLVWLTPQMDRLFQEGAAARRRFLDRLVFGFDPDHAARLAAYEQAVSERLRLLRAGGADPHWLAVLETRMAEDGVAVGKARREVTALLHESCAAGIADPIFARPALAITGSFETAFAAVDAADAIARFQRDLAQSRRIDAESGTTTEGPHRADFMVIHHKKQVPAIHCSTGEQKALLIAIILAHARLQMAVRGMNPVLLLDEVVAHLDEGRRAALFEAISTMRVQAWLTGTDEGFFKPLRAQARFFAIDQGRVVDAG